jgi:hypothetical protein
MNSILYNPAETGLDVLCNVAETTTPEDMYATTPLAIVRPTYAQPNEEELHTSFEEAISDRVLAVNRQLRYLSIPLTGSLSVLSPMYTSIKPQSLVARPGLPKYASRQTMLSVAIAFMLIMVGFDLMGLLVLHLR